MGIMSTVSIEKKKFTYRSYFIPHIKTKLAQ